MQTTGTMRHAATPLLARSRTEPLLVIIYVVIAAVGSLEMTASHLRHPLVAALGFAIVLAAATFFLLFRPLPTVFRRVLSNPYPWILLLAAVMALDVYHYSRVRFAPDPMTTAMAITEPGKRLLHGHEPYSVQLPHGSPVSPGPGWIVLLLPLSSGSLIALIDGLALAATAALLWRISPVASSVMVLLCMAQPMFQSEAANGQDLFAISLVFASLCLAACTVSLTGTNMVRLGLLSGFFATSRVPIVIFFGIIAVGLWKRSRRASAFFLGTTVTTCLALHLGFGYWSARNHHRYPPLHVFGRANQGTPIWSAIACLLLLAACVWIALRVNSQVESQIFAAWLAMTALFAPIGIKEFIQSHFNLGWEGSNYIAFPLPLLAAVIAIAAGRAARKMDHEDNRPLPQPIAS